MKKKLITTQNGYELLTPEYHLTLNEGQIPFSQRELEDLFFQIWDVLKQNKPKCYSCGGVRGLSKLPIYICQCTDIQ